MKVPLYILPGGLRSAPRARKQYLPTATAVEFGGVEEVLEEEEGVVRTRSPRIMTSGWMTALPPSIMFWVPWRLALRDTLFPLSC